MLESTPAHLRKVQEYELQSLFYSDGWFLLHCILCLLKNGKLKEPTEDQRKAKSKHLNLFHKLPQDNESYGLVHFDFSDGNYHVDMETGAITVFDFDNCMYCWYIYKVKIKC